MIFIDTRGHMVSDKSVAELLQFGVSLGLRRKWFQGKRRGHPHYDLTTARIIVRALEKGAVLVPSKELVRRMARS